MKPKGERSGGMSLKERKLHIIRSGQARAMGNITAYGSLSHNPKPHQRKPITLPKIVLREPSP